ncbi:MAG: metal dependent phosphohydrolase [Verrucomicrobiaceae bacterium]|nr:metal dependent phosphohydrolase [Verrucomicrobiaceae bacterium]
MFEAFRRAQLQREGLSCGRTRRKHQEDDLVESLRCHPRVAWVLMGLFVVGVLVIMHLAGGLTEGTKRPELWDSNTLYALALTGAALVHFNVAHRSLMQDNRNTLLVLGTLLLHLIAVWGTMRFGIHQGWSGGLLVMVLPHALAPLVLSVLLGRRAGLFAATYVTLLGAVVFLPVNRLTFLAASALVGFLAVLVTRKVRRRYRLFIGGCYIGLGTAIFSALLALTEGGQKQFDWELVSVPLMIGIFTSMVAGGLLPVLESIFGITTDITWLELADLNHPLMRRLSIEAPGTYHHSLVVANLAEAAAEAIGASATMCRVCSYFHDIGKLNKPEYFIENMDPADNPHDGLTARMSALVLIAHVKDGVDIAIKHNLNGKIIDVIEQHHGTSLAWYFYRQALDQKAEVLRLVQQDKANEDDVPQVSEEVFRYPGPKPQFKEAAIVSLADVVESASRTLEKPNASRIESAVDELVMSRLIDGQLDDCDLTIADLAKVKATFVKTLISMMHSRIKYQARETAANREETVLPVAEGKVVPMDAGRLLTDRDPPTSSGRPSRKRPAKGSGVA